MKQNYKLLVILFVLLSSTQLFSQTKVRGKIIDKSTKEPIPFVSVIFKGTTVGVISDFNGYYFLETRKKVDSIFVSYLGYKPKKIPVKLNKYQEINILLESQSINLDEVVVLPGENPALVLLRKIIKNKPRNNPKRYNTYSYKAYNKMEFDLSNIDENFKKSKIFKQFKFIFNYMDTSAISGKNFLPVFITESLSDFYFNKSPLKQKEILKATKISGVKTDKISEFTGQMYLTVNPYNNFVQIFGKGFVSPIASFGKFYYKYYLIDSMFIDNKWCFQISFKPRRKQEPTFTGDFWVNDTTFALNKLKLRIADDANINFVNDMFIEMQYQSVNDSLWFLKKEKYFIDFNLSDKATGFFGRKTTTYNDVKLNIPFKKDFFNANVYQETIKTDSAQDRDSSYWDNNRPVKLTKKELGIYNMVDSIKDVPIFRTWVDVVNTFITGYYVKGKFEFGPYFKLYSFNAIEGNRVRIGGRTSNEFSKKIMFTGHVAYGELDNRVKESLGFIYVFNTNPRKALGASFKHDIEQLGISQNAFTQDNILASFLRRTDNKKLTMVNQANVFYEYEWYQGFSNKLALETRRIYGTEYVPFTTISGEDTSNLPYISSTEIKLNTRYAFNEKFIMGAFERVSLGTRYPILNFDITIGLKNILKSKYNYYKFHASIDHKFNINPFGKFRYIIDAGLYLGKAPYPLLQLHEGNETYAYDDYAFNMMNYYEFVSDKYVSILAEHHFNGFFLNHIPLFRKLKWREVITAKGLIGRVSNTNEKLMKFPGNLKGLDEPYFEASAGIENILKLFRVDAMWRLSYLDQPQTSTQTIPNFGIRVQLKVQF